MEQKKMLVLKIEANEDAILGNVEDLCSAAALGVENVMFLYSVEGKDSIDMLNSVTPKLNDACEILNIKPFSRQLTSYTDFFRTSIGDMNENGCVESFGSLIDFSTFKGSNSNQDVLKRNTSEKNL